MHESIDPLLEYDKDASWLTVGDGRYASDARYIKKKGISVLATDISDSFLKQAKNAGEIDHFQKANAEHLPFGDNTYDFVLCKQSYHHFPRPMIALYEMLRVAERGVVLIEPNDGRVGSTLLAALARSCRDLLKTVLFKGVVKQHFEETGNYVYAISARELEKVAMGLNLGAVAFKGINDYYVKGVEHEKISENNRLFKKVKWRIGSYNLLSRLRLIQYRLLVAIMLKQTPDANLERDLKLGGYKVISLPTNPYV